MKALLYITLLLFTGNMALAQNARFTTSATIEYQRSANTLAILKKMIGEVTRVSEQALEQYKKTQPQFKLLNSTLIFNNDKILYTPVAVEAKPNAFFGAIPMADQNNTVYTDLATNNSISQKVVLDETFLVKDNLRKIKWKITDETREIAGYTCHRANGIMLDSVYVVAFFADRIPVSSGPESFAGLPGMILLVSLPHDNVTWTATKVTDMSVPLNTIIPPKKGKPVNSKEFEATVNNGMKNWGLRGKSVVMAFLL